MPILYIVAIGWIYVVLMMSVTEPSVIAGIATFLFYGMLPLGVILYLMNTPKRRAQRAEAEKLRRVRMQQRSAAADSQAAPAEIKPDP